MTIGRLTIEPSATINRDLAIAYTATGTAVTLTEALYRLRRWLFHRPHEEPLPTVTASDLRDFWRRHDERMAKIEGHREAEPADRSP